MLDGRVGEIGPFFVPKASLQVIKEVANDVSTRINLGANKSVNELDISWPFPSPGTLPHSVSKPDIRFIVWQMSAPFER